MAVLAAAIEGRPSAKDASPRREFHRSRPRSSLKWPVLGLMAGLTAIAGAISGQSAVANLVAAGAILGCVGLIAAMLSGRLTRARKPAGFSEYEDDPGYPGPPRGWGVLGLLAVLTAIASSGAIGFVVGALVVQSKVFQNRIEDRLVKIASVLRDQPLDVEPVYSSDGEVFLTGTVNSEESYKALQERLLFLFGDEEAKFMMRPVEIESR